MIVGCCVIIDSRCVVGYQVSEYGWYGLVQAWCVWGYSRFTLTSCNILIIGFIYWVMPHDMVEIADMGWGCWYGRGKGDDNEEERTTSMARGEFWQWKVFNQICKQFYPRDIIWNWLTIARARLMPRVPGARQCQRCRGKERPIMMKGMSWGQKQQRGKGKAGEKCNKWWYR